MEARRHPQRGYWEVYFRYPDPDNPRNNLTFRKKSPVQTRRGAEKRGREMLAIYSDPVRLREETRALPTFQTFAREVERVVWKVELSDRSVAKYRSVLDNQILPTLGDLIIDQIDVQKLTHWRADMVEADLSVEYINAATRIASQILGVAKSWGMITLVPTLKRLPPEEEEPWDYLTEDEQDRLEAQLDDTLDRDCMIIIALDTGMRDGEIRAMTWGNIDLKAKQIWVKHSLTSKGKLGPTKNRKHRMIPMTERVAKILTRQRAKTLLAGDWVWTEEGKPYKTNKILRRLRSRLRLAGMREIRVHDLRHTFASRLVQRGVSLQVVKELLGHSRIKETERYAHLAPEQHAEAVAALERTKLYSDCTENAEGLDPECSSA